MPVFCLSLHAAYRCAHAGACCTAGWEIPAETAVLEAVRIGSVAVADAEGPLFVRGGAPGVAVSLARRRDGSCAFFEPDRGRLCAIHRQAGPAHLPSACRHFPRVVLRDPRGTFVTLSHFCPTAASMLLAPTPLRIVEAPPSIALDGCLEGLDATAVLPPLLRGGMLMDYAGYSAWEREGIAVLDRDDLDADDAVRAIAAATERITTWAPGRESLADCVERAFRDAVGVRGTRPAVECDGDRPVRAFLAAHLFACWAAYQGGGLQAVVNELRTALETLRREQRSGQSFVEAVRAADLRLRHSEEVQLQTPNSKGDPGRL